MVSSPITVAGLTWNPVSAYTPVAMTRWGTKATTSDLVEDHHGVVQGVAEDGQQPDNGRGTDLEPGERVHAGRDDQVMDQGDEGRYGHLPVKGDREVQHDHDQERDERFDRLGGDLA